MVCTIGEVRGQGRSDSYEKDKGFARQQGETWTGGSGGQVRRGKPCASTGETWTGGSGGYAVRALRVNRQRRGLAVGVALGRECLACISGQGEGRQA